MNSIRFDVISLSPNIFNSLENMGVITRAIEKKLIAVNVYDLREFGQGNYRQVDDEPYGGGSGMVLKPEPIYKAYESIKKVSNEKTFLMTPQGKTIKQSDFVRWSSLDQIIIICGQYEGFDERVRHLADEEISLGDFILTGGEIPAVSIINGIARLIPGTLGDPYSLEDESHNNSLLEYPQYTRPAIFRDMKVPDILLSGNHKEIKSWRKSQMQKNTMLKRSDLILYEQYDNFLDRESKKADFVKLKKLIIDYEKNDYPDW